MVESNRGKTRHRASDFCVLPVINRGLQNIFIGLRFRQRGTLEFEGCPAKHDLADELFPLDVPAFVSASSYSPGPSGVTTTGSL